MSQAPGTSNEYRQIIAALLAELIPPEQYYCWMVTSHSALNGESPILAMQKGNEVAVYHLLLPDETGQLNLLAALCLRL